VIHIPAGMYDQALQYTLSEDMPVQVLVNGRSYILPKGSVTIQSGIIEGIIAELPEAYCKQFGLILDIGGILVSSEEFVISSLELRPDFLECVVGEQRGWFVLSENPPSWVVYRWDFGDGTVQETNDTSITHSYTNEGEFKITVQMRDSNTAKVLAIANGKVMVLPQNNIPKETPIPTIEPTPEYEEPPVEETPPVTSTPAPTPDEEKRRQDILAEYRALYPQSLRNFHKFGRIEVIANAEEVGPDQYRVAYKLWQIIEDGPRKGEEYEAVSLDLIFNLGQLEADLAIMRKNLGIE
jgi:hypothetical protein